MRIDWNAWKLRLADFLHRELVPCVLVLALLLLHLLALDSLNADYSLNSDDGSYIRSGIVLAQTGTLTMHDEYPSAQIMPGMSAVIALFYLVLGDGKALWLGLKLLWALMGSLSAWFLYHSVRLFAPTWCAVTATLLLFRTDFIWTDNLILTETPFILCFTVMIYCTFQMGRSDKKRYFIGCAVAYFAALMLKANIGLYPAFAGAYLLLVHYDWKKLFKQGLILALALLCILTPWTIRNYLQFDAFIPLTYGAGNPTLLGTYQGTGFPADEELDYETNVEQVVRERYAKYFNEDGTVIPRYVKYVALARDQVMASYRMSVWWENDPGSFLLSYLVLKPINMIGSVFYWGTVWNVNYMSLYTIHRIGLVVCVAAALTIPFSKKRRPELLFLGALYLGNVYLYCMTFSFDRYNISLLPALFVFLGIGLHQLAELGSRVTGKLREKGFQL